MLTLEQYEKLVPACHLTHEGKTISCLTPSTFLKWRVDSLYTTEPCRDLLLYDIRARTAAQQPQPQPAQFSFS